MADKLALARGAARAGGDIAGDHFREDLRVETKAHKNDLVSEADTDAQARVIERLREDSDAPIIGEEGEARTTVPEEGPAWVVDPIDGTANYLRGLRLWTTTVAAVESGEPVAAVTTMPALSDEYAASDGTTRLNGDPATTSDRTDIETFAVAVVGWGGARERSAYLSLAEEVITRCGDMRRFGSMQATLAFVADGGLDAAITTRRPSPWDTIVGVHLIRQAGGTVTNLAGDRWRHDDGALIASNGAVHSEVLDVARASAEGAAE